VAAGQRHARLAVRHHAQPARRPPARQPPAANRWTTPAGRPSDRRPAALRDLDSALRLLPPEQREVVLLVALEELSYEEVAALLQIPAGTVMSRLSRGRERLRLLMEGQPLPSPLKVIK
jgi:RNA polymerase sigma-70 factor (ECF subfamily)